MNDTTELARKDETAVGRREDDQSQRRTTLAPPVDIFEDSQGVTLWADLPGVTKDRLDVKVHDGNLYIEAEAGGTDGGRAALAARGDPTASLRAGVLSRG